LVAGRTEKIFTAAHDLSQGGLSATLTEMVLRHNVGAKVTLENVGVALISETPGRVVVAVEPNNANQLIELAKSKDIKIAKLGSTGGDSLVINDAVISLDELRKAHTETFPKLFG
jgi:phosphoribosylformylglycinamidine synthase